MLISVVITVARHGAVAVVDEVLGKKLPSGDLFNIRSKHG